MPRLLAIKANRDPSANAERIINRRKHNQKSGGLNDLEAQSAALDAIGAAFVKLAK